MTHHVLGNKRESRKCLNNCSCEKEDGLLLLISHKPKTTDLPFISWPKTVKHPWKWLVFQDSKKRPCGVTGTQRWAVRATHLSVKRGQKKTTVRREWQPLKVAGIPGMTSVSWPGPASELDGDANTEAFLPSSATLRGPGSLSRLALCTAELIHISWFNSRHRDASWFSQTWKKRTLELPL